VGRRGQHRAVACLAGIRGCSPSAIACRAPVDRAAGTGSSVYILTVGFNRLDRADAARRAAASTGPRGCPWPSSWPATRCWPCHGSSSFGRSPTTRSDRRWLRVADPSRGHRVVSTGVYGWVRNPMYLGATLMFVGGAARQRRGLGAGGGPGLRGVAPGGCAASTRRRCSTRDLPGYAEYRRPRALPPRPVRCVTRLLPHERQEHQPGRPRGGENSTRRWKFVLG